MTQPEFLAPHALVLQPSPRQVLFYQALLRRGILTDPPGASALLAYIGEQSCDVATVRCRDVTSFSLADCLLDNPAGIQQSATLETTSFDSFLALLRDSGVLVTDASYTSRVGKTRNVFDRERMGNFHQQIGRFLFEGGRRDPSRWWIDQKFNADLSATRDTPYSWVQQTFMDTFFPESLQGQRWLDFGCGVGFYTAFFARRGAHVLGVDPSDPYIDIAKEHFSRIPGTEFRRGVFRTSSDFDAFRGRRFDRIFLSDVFLYYFEPYEPLELTPAALLRELGRLLNPGGVIYILDPHGCFHLQPWLGHEMPFLVSTEYHERKYRVTPTLEEVSRAAEDAGLTIRKIRELTAPETESGTQARNIAREFPLWWFFELGPRH